MRVTVTKSHGIGYHIRTPYETKTVAQSTLKTWIKDYTRKVDNANGFGLKRDNRDANGVGTIEFEYFVNGCLNRELFTVQPEG